jgi:hypothetical protein
MSHIKPVFGLEWGDFARRLVALSQRYFALDIHREYILVGAQNEDQEWVVVPRRVGIEKFPGIRSVGITDVS